MERGHEAALADKYQVFTEQNMSMMAGYDVAAPQAAQLDGANQWQVLELQLEANRSVVVSEGLALALFFTDDVVGKSLEVAKQAYTICGVAKADVRLLQLSGSGRPQRS